MKDIFIFFLTSLMLLCARMHPTDAEAPLTPKILFTSARDGNYEVYTMNPDGSEQMNLTRHRANDLQAAWSPTGEQIIFVSDRDGARDLYLMGADGSNVRPVFKFKIKTWRERPTWAPNGKQIAYVHINWDILNFTIRIATLEEQESEEFVVGPSQPAWSPDGSQIACSIGGRIAFINIRTRLQKRLLPEKATNWQFQPSWSGTGDKIAFAWNSNPLPPDLEPGKPVPGEWVDKQTIYIANHDGTDLKQLVDEAGPRADYPVLSPNGKEILYTQEINGFLQIFKIGVDSGIRMQLTHIEPRNLGGDWFDPAYALPVSPQPQLLTTIWGKIKKE